MPILANVIEDAFSPLISLFQSIMVFIHAHLVGGSWGLAIVGLTVTIRAVLVPLTFRQLKSMQEMQRLAPEINAIKEKYKEDKQRQQQEMMKFYQENKINPLASCLPLLLQLPVFVSLFYMLRTDLKKKICGNQLVAHFNSAGLSSKYGGASHVTSISHLPGKYIEQTSCNTVAPHSAKFLFLPDITSKATGAALVVLIVLYVGSQIASTLIATATADPNQRRLMLALPVIFVIILYRYPAGLLVYWITTNLWTIVQQFVIKRRMGPAPARPGAAGGAAPPSNGKPPRGGLKPLLSGGGGGATAEVAAAVGTKAERAPGKPGEGNGGGGGKPGAAPPPPPRKKKKRSGRRR
jgi:YidC/Oxa1 family membrane protein insertase